MTETSTKYLFILENAQALAEKGHVNTGICMLRDVVSESGVPPDIKQQCWYALSEMLEQSWIQQVAVHTYELTSFLDRFGMELVLPDNDFCEESVVSDTGYCKTMPVPPLLMSNTESRRSSSADDLSDGTTVVQGAECASPSRDEHAVNTKENGIREKAKRCAICQRRFKGKLTLGKRVHRHLCIMCQQTVCGADYCEEQRACMHCSTSQRKKRVLPAVAINNNAETSMGDTEADGEVSFHHPECSQNDPEDKEERETSDCASVVCAVKAASSNQYNLSRNYSSSSTLDNDQGHRPHLLPHHAVSEINISRNNTFIACSDWEREAASEVSSIFSLQDPPRSPPATKTTKVSKSQQIVPKSPRLLGARLTRFFHRHH